MVKCGLEWENEKKPATENVFSSSIYPLLRHFNQHQNYRNTRTRLILRGKSHRISFFFDFFSLVLISLWRTFIAYLRVWVFNCAYRHLILSMWNWFSSFFRWMSMWCYLFDALHILFYLNIKMWCEFVGPFPVFRLFFSYSLHLRTVALIQETCCQHYLR